MCEVLSLTLLLGQCMRELFSVLLTGAHSASLPNFMIADLETNVSLHFEPYSFRKSQLWKFVLH